MKHVVALSISLVAVSASAGFGLSALHDLNSENEGKRASLSAPETAAGVSLVPAFLGALPATPSIEDEAITTIPAFEPVQTAALSPPMNGLESPVDQSAQDVPVQTAISATPAAAPSAATASAPVSMQAISTPTKTMLYSRSHAKSQPFFVIQTPPIQRDLGRSDRPDYIIGMFR
ncbi:MAG: hypothetical protein GJ676_08785 [Rhodobacteraceae bacterium]|nr:hypothetical protein [Paracoccaceae bacterium]